MGPKWSLIVSLVFSVLQLSPPAPAQEKALVAYGGHNETAAPMWVGIEKGLFRKHGVEAHMLQVRSGPIIMATLASEAVKLVWPAPSSALSAIAGGLAIRCVASPTHKMGRQLVVRKEIKSLEELRGRSFGVQSIGGGFWLQTMIVLDGLGIDPDKFGLKMRVLGDTGTVTQALISENVDAAALPYSFANMAKRAGFKFLADSADLKSPYQGPGLCVQRELASKSPDLVARLLRGLIDAVLAIHDPASKRDVVQILEKHLKFRKAEDAEESYNLLRSTTTLDIAPNFPAWETVRRIVARVNPKVAQVDLKQLLDSSFVERLETTGVLPEARKKAKL